MSDLVIVETAKIPEVRSLYVSRSFGNPSLLIPWENVHTLTGRGIEVIIGDLNPYEIEPTEDVILLRDYVLDKKVIDLEENEVEMVYDIRLCPAKQETLCHRCRYREGCPSPEARASDYSRRSSTPLPTPRQSR